MFKLLTILLLAIVLFVNMNFNLAFAQTSPVNSSVSAMAVATPTHLSSFIDRVKEKIIMFFQFSAEAKTNYQLQLVDERLNDLVYVVNTKQGDLIEEMSSRYETYVNKLGELAVSGKVNNTLIIAELNKNIQTLESLNSQFESNNAFWLLTMHDINSTKDTIAKIQSH